MKTKANLTLSLARVYGCAGCAKYAKCPEKVRDATKCLSFEVKNRTQHDTQSAFLKNIYPWLQ